jgi:ABC-2 type transport system permease protein
VASRAPAVSAQLDHAVDRTTPSPIARDLEGIWAIWIRELIVFKREKVRVISSLVQPLLWIFVFGGGVSANATVPGGNYRAFIFPGILIMSTLFTCVFYGMYVVWDKKLDVLKQVLVSPISRIAIFTGKVLGGSTDALVQAALLLILGLFLTPMRLVDVPAALVLVALAAVGLTALGLAIGSFFESPEGFQLVLTFLVFPMFFLSGAVYALTHLELWLRIATRINPVTYMVDALRGILLHLHTFPIALDFLVVAAFSAVMVGFGSWAFSRTR